MSQAQKWQPISPKLRRVQEIAKANRKERFTSLAHHLTIGALTRSYNRLDAKSAPGVDGVTKEEYGKELHENLKDVHERLKSGKYRATPVLRRWIEKPEGGKRPLGLPTTEDKIVQGAVVEILNSIYEGDFYGFSYGFRPGKSAHQALQALQTVLQKGRVNWVLDADIKGFFDNIDHKELMSLLRHRVTDSRLLGIIGKWLAAGVVEEDGRRERPKKGVPQGGVISPLLANIFLHYALDDYVHEWRKSKATGEVYIVRYADDFVLCFEHEQDAKALLDGLHERFAGYGLELNRDKSRLLRFGRPWGKSGKPKADSFDYLGFTHICGKSRKGGYLVIRKSSGKRLNRSLKAVAEWLRRHRHLPLQWQWKQLCLKLQGHYNYYGLRGNYESLQRYRNAVFKLWYKWLCHRSQKPNKNRVHKLITERYILPKARITHTEGWLALNPGYLLGRAGCGKSARPVL